MTTAFLGLGSNLGDRAALLREAVRLLEGAGACVTRQSPIYETAAWGGVAQPPFLNQVIAVETARSPRMLLEQCFEVERALGRERNERWGPRTMDVDLLLYGDQTILEPDLVVPHAEMTRRAFVLAPLADVGPARLPNGMRVQELLEACPDRDAVWRWDGRQAVIVGREIRWYETLPSTNDAARQIVDSDVDGAAGAGRDIEGTVVIAEEQTAGRGRLGRLWVSPRGGVWLSAILNPGLPPGQAPLLGLAAAVAVAEVIDETFHLPVRLKWPNDVIIRGRKVAGLLLEAASAGRHTRWVILGIGINANVAPGALPVRADYPATSLQATLGRRVERGPLTQALLRALDRRYLDLRDAGPAGALRCWRERSDTLGRTVRVATGAATVTGFARDVDQDGALLLRTHDGVERRIIAGDVA